MEVVLQHGARPRQGSSTARWVWRLVVVVLAALGLGALGLQAPNLEAEEPRSIHRELPARAAGEVVVELLAGVVEVEGHDERSIVLDAELGAAVGSLDVLEDGQRVVVRAKVDDTRRTGEAAAVTLRMKIPKASRVRIQTLDASLRTAGLEGKLELETVAGEIRVTGATSREVLVTTATGQVHLEAPSLRGRVRSASGAVRVSADVHDLGVVTATADVRVAASVVEEMELQTVSGEVELEGTVAPTGRLRVRSHTGDVRLRLPSDLSAQLRLESRRGRVTNSLGSGGDSVAAQDGGVDLVLGRGGPSIDVESLDGDIFVETR